MRIFAQFNGVCPKCEKRIDENDRDVICVKGNYWHKECNDEQVKTAANISEGFRVCRKCGNTVQNEFDFKYNGLMCDKCCAADHQRMFWKPDVNEAEKTAQVLTPSNPQAIDDGPRKWLVKVIFDDGDSLETWINGTQEEIRRHYLNNDFVLADETTTHRGINVEFVEDLGDVPWTYYGESARPKEAMSLWELKKTAQGVSKIKYVVEGMMKARDVFEADDPEQAVMLFKAKYPACQNKDANITCVPLDEFGKKPKTAQFVPSYRDRPNRTHEMPRSKPLELPEGTVYIDSGYWELPAVVAKRLCGGKLPKPGYERVVEFGGSKWAIHETPVHGKMVWGLRWIKNLDSESPSQGG